MSVVATLRAIQFVFDWIVATIIAVEWCYTFKLACPHYSETVLGWGLYTLSMIIFMPYLRMWLLNRLRDDEEKQAKATLQGWKLLLTITCGTAVGTALSGLAALLFPGLASQEFFSPGLATGLLIAVMMTVCFVLIQAGMEWLYHERLEELPESSYWKHLIIILLCSTWGFLGFFWNSVWDLQLRILSDYIGHVGAEDGESLLSVSSLLPHHGVPRVSLIGLGEKNGMKTITDCWYGRPTSSGSLGLWWISGKAIVTTLLTVMTLYLLPDPPPVDEKRFVTRRFRLAVQMMSLTVAAYATTDMGYYFGTRYVAAETGSEWLGLAAAFAYAFLISCVVCGVSVSKRFETRGNFAKWCFQLACFDVCYAWWYCWQELLYQIQGYALSPLMDWLEAFFMVVLAVCQAILMTYTWVVCIKFIASWVVSAAIEKATKRGEVVDLEKLKASSLTDSMRFLTICCGIHPSMEEDRERVTTGGSYGSADLTGHTADAGAADIAGDAGAAI